MAESNLTKICTQCQTEKSIESFSVDNRSIDGLQTKCKNCDNQYYQDNKIKIISRVTANAKKNKLSIAEYQKQYHKWYSQTENGKAREREKWTRYRALKRGAIVETFSPNEVFERDGYKCQLCGCKTRPDFKNYRHPLYPNLDHIIPLSKGGEHSRKNTQCLCRLCNTKKNNRKVGDQLRLF